jgi:antitoxin VapB
MAKEAIAKLFRNGRSQAVRLPREFRFEGDCVRVRRIASGVLLEPMYSDAKKWFAAMDEFGAEPFPARVQPLTPKRDLFE